MSLSNIISRLDMECEATGRDVAQREMHSLLAKAQELEAEVQRLRVDYGSCLRHGASLIEEIRAYRAAVAELRAFLGPFDDGSSDDAAAVSEHAIDILDKLPKDEP